MAIRGTKQVEGDCPHCGTVEIACAWFAPVERARDATNGGFISDQNDRAGEQVELEPRRVTVHELVVHDVRLGADHVGIGTDIEGVGLSWSVNNYSHVRSLVDALQELELPASAIEKVASGNYARVLKAALKG